MGEIRIHIKLLLENQKERDHMGDLGVDWRIILRRTLSYCFRIETNGGLF
jgi:hypothetical protein